MMESFNIPLVVKFHPGLTGGPVPLCLTCLLTDSSFQRACERSPSTPTFVDPAGVAWHQRAQRSLLS